MIRFVMRFGGTAVAVAAGASLGTASLGAVSGCGPSCGDIACIEAVTVRPDVILSEAGNYEVDFVADGVATSCTVKVPSTVPAKCTNQRAYVAQPDGHGITFVSLDGEYSSLQVTMLRDGTSIADQTYAPKYDGAELDGPGCGTCPAASERLTTNAGDIADAGGVADGGK
jgi:hypothetical protein